MSAVSVIRLGQELSGRARSSARRLLRDRHVWLETAGITLAALALGAAFHRDNMPLQIQGEFPWVWLGPLLIALRYGLMPGLVSSLGFIVTWELQTYHNAARFPTEFFFGGVVMVALGAEFAEGWGGRLRRAEDNARHLNERLRRVTHQHLLLKCSHDRMEHELLARPASLRGALAELRKLTTVQSEHLVGPANSLLQLLAQYCQLDSAAIFVPGRGKDSYQRVAEIGSPPDLVSGDPLLAHALEHRALSHLLPDAPPAGGQRSGFLVVAPALASDGTVVAMLAVERMPFLALNEENLQMLSVLLAYYADCKVESDDVRQFIKEFPDASLDVATEFSRMLRLQREHGINSHLVALSFANDEAGRRAISEHERGMRSLDVAWRVDTGSRLLLANLMPLAEKPAVDSYLNRVEGGHDDPPGNDHPPDGQHPAYSRAPVVISLAEREPWASLAGFIRGEAPC